VAVTPVPAADEKGRYLDVEVSTKHPLNAGSGQARRVLLTVTQQALFSLAGSNIYNDQKLASNLVTGSHLPRMMFMPAPIAWPRVAASLSARFGG
jgi:hypothetical protein